MSDYWQETIEEAAHEVELKMTSEQARHIAKAVEVSHENYGMAHGHHCIPNPENTEIARLEKALEQERSKVICATCKGAGQLFDAYGTRGGAYSCWKCNGAGRHLP